MYRYPTRSKNSKPVFCSSEDCKAPAESNTYVSNFRIDYVSVGKKQVITGNDLMTTDLCKQCFVAMIQRQFAMLDANEKLNE